MKQSVISDYSNAEIISESLKHSVVLAFKKSTLYPQESIYQIAKQFDLEPSDVIKIYEEHRNGNKNT